MRILKKIAIGLLVVIVVLAAAGWWVTRGVPAEYTLAQVTGTDPLLAEPDEQTVPTVQVAAPIGWADGAAPDAAEGLSVNRFAEGLAHPRVIYAMPTATGWPRRAMCCATISLRPRASPGTTASSTSPTTTRW